jgi:hypothetical protein
MVFKDVPSFRFHYQNHVCISRLSDACRMSRPYRLFYLIIIIVFGKQNHYKARHPRAFPPYTLLFIALGLILSLLFAPVIFCIKLNKYMLRECINKTTFVKWKSRSSVFEFFCVWNSILYHLCLSLFSQGPAILHNIFCLYSLYYLFHLLKMNGNVQGTVIRISV